MSYESSTPAQLRAFFEQHEIHTVETAVADSQGHLRGKRVPVRRFFDTVIENGDHVIVFLVDKRYTKEVEKLFHVGFSFF